MQNLHQKYPYAICYPLNNRAVGTSQDVLAFFSAIELCSEDAKTEFPIISKFYRYPTVGAEILELFQEVKLLKQCLGDIKANAEILQKIGVDLSHTGLNIKSVHLAQAFEKILRILTENAPEMARLDIEEFGSDILNTQSVLICPAEPLVIEGMFNQLPLSVFDECDPPMWFRDEIFDERWYIGKI
ncbi:hypothetical protein [Halocynthiibacter styelae]|uniref:Uncharacterized protein n=1 Tax=Halocynthiibacter styelae TaxID=2761955 RepID=A0A8J7ILS9_9RHOB|nr:hypothetical protein [Paenihalocynthiibacter styelae]MBI1492796.1 hypothetical protein [Paenihalocynthiibacter styelae]